MKITAIDCHVLLIPAAREDATDSALQHGQSGLLAVPQLGSCTSSLCAWRLWAARHSSHCLGCSSPPPPKPPIPPPLTVQAQDNLVVFIHTDAGITGVGESDANPWMLKAAIEAPSTHTMGMGLKDMLMGADPLDDAEALRLCGHGEPWSAWTWRAG